MWYLFVFFTDSRYRNAHYTTSSVYITHRLIYYHRHIIYITTRILYILPHAYYIYYHTHIIYWRQYNAQFISKSRVHLTNILLRILSFIILIFFLHLFGFRIHRTWQVTIVYWWDGLSILKWTHFIATKPEGPKLINGTMIYIYSYGRCQKIYIPLLHQYGKACFVSAGRLIFPCGISILCRATFCFWWIKCVFFVLHRVLWVSNWHFVVF